MKFILRIIYIILLLLLPFILLVRLSVYCYAELQYEGGISILIASAATILLMVIYFSFMYAKMTGKLGTWMGFKRRIYGAAFIVLSFAAYTLFYISGKQVKQSSIRSEFLELHPILRVGLSTLIIFDQSLLITDASRQPEDYKKMGLKSRSQSLHYIQKSGFSHAFDLRTKGRSELKNNAVEYYFKLMGFNTLRHVGTADHLHISLSPRENKYAK